MRKTLTWARARWLDIVLLLVLAGIVAWIAVVARSFFQSPTEIETPPVPIPAPSSTLTPEVPTGDFDGESAMGFVRDQLAIGPRSVGSEGAERTANYLVDRLEQWGWTTEIEEFVYRGVVGRNIIGRAGKGPVLLLGAHYDTRRIADQDETASTEPVPGANDGASGVAVLLELARTLDTNSLKNEVWLAFFDAEDNGGLDGWEFSAGSEYMAEHLETPPAAVIVVDMIGDADQNIYKERNSNPELQNQIWGIAQRLGYGNAFIPEYKWSMTDDHTPFLRRGYAAVDLIDFDYPFWHTTKDTIDKVSALSLERVGRVLQTFIEETE